MRPAHDEHEVDCAAAAAAANLKPAALNSLLGSAVVAFVRAVAAKQHKAWCVMITMAWWCGGVVAMMLT